MDIITISEPMVSLVVSYFVILSLQNLQAQHRLNNGVYLMKVDTIFGQSREIVIKDIGSMQTNS